MLGLIWFHFFADFILQSHEMSVNKSKSVMWLLYHCAVYALPFTLCYGVRVGVFTMCSHFLVDLISSKATSKLWSMKEMHWFFCVVGLDQATHLTVLFLTIKYLF